MTSLTIEKGSLVVKTKYSAGMIAMIKSLPYQDRKWDADRKVWLVDPKHGARVAEWISQFFGETVSPPAAEQPKLETRTIEVRYIGRCKERPDGEWTAMGWVRDEWVEGDEDGSWSVIFSEAVLKEWFEGKIGAIGHLNSITLYGVLGISKTATLDEIKSAYRKMAKVWHPDVNHEPDAEEHFKRINEAYQIINDPNKRARYDAGLELEATLKNGNSDRPSRINLGYRSPLLCGSVTVEGYERLGKFHVQKILAFEDIRNDRGQILVTSWPMGMDHFVEAWI